MKVVKLSLVAALVAAISASQAHAAASAWYRLAGGADSQTVLDLPCNVSGCSFNVELRGQFSNAIQTWGLDLGTASPLVVGSAPTANGAAFPGALPGAPGAGPALLTGSGFLGLVPPLPAAGTYTLGTLTVTYNGPIDGSIHTINGTINNFEWVDADAGDYYNVSFAGRPAILGSAGSNAGAMFRIVTPEPGTLVLTALGALALLRRRSN